MKLGCQFHIIAGGGPMDGGNENRRGATPSRKIVLIDIENMLFGAHERSGDVRPWEILCLAEARRPTDMIIVGCNPQLAFLAKEHFPQARIVTGHGKNGADQALIETLDMTHVAERFTELCIVSGDHAFASIAHAARKAGLRVRVVGPHLGLSTELRVQADTAVLLPEIREGKAA